MLKMNLGPYGPKASKGISMIFIRRLTGSPKTKGTNPSRSKPKARVSTTRSPTSYHTNLFMAQTLAKMQNADLLEFLEFRETKTHTCEERVSKGASVWTIHTGILKDCVERLLQHNM